MSNETPVNIAQHYRKERVMMAITLYGVCWLILLISHILNVMYLPFPSLPLLLLFACIVNGQLLRLIRTGKNLHFSDPSLTQWQLAMASVWAMPPIYFNPALRGEILMVHATVYFFGCFRLTRIQFLKSSIVPIVLYVLVIFSADTVQASDDTFKQEVLRLLLLVLSLAIISLGGGVASDLRAGLRKKQKELELANEKIQHQATRDSLTGLYNRRYLMDALAREEALIKRRGGIFSIIIADIDHFKMINDHFGHLTGDSVLRNVARTLSEQLRSADAIASKKATEVVARLGGEEFLVLLPDCDIDGAALCAERLRYAIEQLQSAQQQHITASFGVAAYRLGDHMDQLISRADTALYEAKHGGRNCIVVAR